MHNYTVQTKEILNQALAISERPDFASNTRFRSSGPKRLSIQGLLLHYLGENDRAAQSLETSLGLSQGKGGEWVRAETLGILGTVTQFRGQPQRARQLYQESLAIRRELGDLRGIALALSLLGFLCVNNAEPVRADLLLQESLVTPARTRRPIWRSQCPQLAGRKRHHVGRLYNCRALSSRELGDLSGAQRTLWHSTQSQQSRLCL